MEPFLGEIKAVGFNFAPRGYAFCNATIMNIAQNSALFALLGTTFGGNGQTTFGLPDLRGRVAVGQGQGPGLSAYQLGQAGGMESTSISLSQMPIHNHLAATTVTPTFTDPTATTTINALAAPTSRVAPPTGNLLTVGYDPGASSNMQNYAPPGGGTAVTLAPGAATTTVTGGGVTATASTTVQPAGNGLPLGILQPLLAINYIIATEGVFPTRN